MAVEVLQAEGVGRERFAGQLVGVATADGYWPRLGKGVVRYYLPGVVRSAAAVARGLVPQRG